MTSFEERKVFCVLEGEQILVLRDMGGLACFFRGLLARDCQINEVIIVTNTHQYTFTILSCPLNWSIVQIKASI